MATKMTSDLEKKFKKAAFLIRKGPPKPDTSSAVKLKYYSYYKQATEGDIKGEQPWAVQLEARAKWDAWNALEGMSKEEAMQKYIDLIASGKYIKLSRKIAMI
jgi:diazepam-binding inhibitor (GABA receptor modulator, acyl-CoA-binding protein)